MTKSQGHATKLIDAHFALSTTAAEEQRMRAHLTDCLACSAYYERALVVSRLTPHAPTAKERLRVALDLQKPPRVVRPWAWAASAVALAAAACVFWLTPSQRTQAPPDGWSERGNTDNGALAVYEVGSNDQRQPLAPKAVITKASELTLSYRAPAGFAFVMVFAIDAKGQMFWYEPAWNDARQTPTGKAIRPQRTYAMDDAVAHAFAPGPAKVVAVFLKSKLNVREAESAWQRGDHTLRTLDRAAQIATHPLTVAGEADDATQ